MSPVIYDDAYLRRAYTVPYWKKEWDDHGFMAVCLVGPPRMQRKNDSNGSHWWPTAIRLTKLHYRGADQDNIRQWQDDVELLNYVYVGNDVHARRLKTAIQDIIIGRDPTLRAGRMGWFDWPEWEAEFRRICGRGASSVSKGRDVVQIFTLAQCCMIVNDAIKHKERMYA